MNSILIACVKLGNKYPSKMVNNLYRMCKKHISIPFEFFCYTDDPSDLYSEVNVLHFVDNGLDIIVYNKMFLFSEEVEKIHPNLPRVFFDLDLIIKDNIDDIITYNQGHTSVINAEWRKNHDLGFPMFHHPINSSCIVWSGTQMRSLWEHLMKDPEMFMNKYCWGMDSFLFYEKEITNTNIGFFPSRKFYSFLYGVDYIENGIHDPTFNGYRPSKFVEVVKSIPIVLFNGPTDPEDYWNTFKLHYRD